MFPALAKLGEARVSAIILFIGLLAIIGAIRVKPALKGKAAVASLVMTAGFLMTQIQSDTGAAPASLSEIGFPVLVVAVAIAVGYLFVAVILKEARGRLERR